MLAQVSIKIASPYIDKKDKKAVIDVLESGYLSLGPKHLEFEKKIAKYCRSKYASSVSNGTVGLHLAVKSLGLKEGDEVITTPFSFVSSSNCLLFERVKPVFVDIEETTYNIDPEKIVKAITKRTKAILVVHIFGQSADMTPILEIAKKKKLKIIEDACESLGAKYRNKMTGTFGEIGVFAFYPNKQMTTGEGGIVVTNNKKIDLMIKSLKNQGRNLKNYRMDEMSAALGITQLEKLDWMINERKKIINLYNRYLSENKKLIIPQIGKDRTHTWFVYVVRVLNNRRNFLMKKLAEKGIQTKPYLPVIHLQPFMKKEFNFKKGDFPIAEKISSETLALPLYIGLKEKQVKYICMEIEKILK